VSPLAGRATCRVSKRYTKSFVAGWRLSHGDFHADDWCRHLCGWFGGQNRARTRPSAITSIQANRRSTGQLISRAGTSNLVSCAAGTFDLPPAPKWQSRASLRPSPDRQPESGAHLVPCKGLRHIPKKTRICAQSRRVIGQSRRRLQNLELYLPHPCALHW
jgi:hypothetical protein